MPLDILYTYVRMLSIVDGRGCRRRPRIYAGVIVRPEHRRTR